MKEWISHAASSLLILLFLYTGLSKVVDRGVFLFTLELSPWHLLQSNAALVSWVLPYLEILVAVLLIPPRTRLWGFYLSAVFMVAFLLYVGIVVGSGVQLPCSCGGVIKYLTWQQHIYFNLAFTLIALCGIWNERREAAKETSKKTILI